MTRRDMTDRKLMTFRSSRLDKVRATLALGAVLGLGAVGTMAAWTDTATATSGIFSAASIDLKVDSQDVVRFAALSMADMVPGSAKTGNLLVRNAGTVSFGYSMRAVIAGNDKLGEYLRVSVSPNSCSGRPDLVPMRSTQSPITMISGPRPLAAGVEETLCFSVALDSVLWNEANWPTAFQVEGKAVDVAFEFTATEQ